MAPTLSPAGRLRSRTSDISDLLRGRHDPKASMDSQRPPMPSLAPDLEPTTPPKKSKFSFLARKRKPSSVSPSSARSANDALRRDQQQRDDPPPPLPTHDGNKNHSQLPPGPSRASTSTSPKALPPPPSAGKPTGNLSAPSLAIPQPEGNHSNSASSSTHQRKPSGIPTATLRNLRTQKSTSFEHIRASIESEARKQSTSSGRPIITISPPQRAADGAQGFDNAPRSAPRPPGHTTARRPSQSGIPLPASGPGASPLSTSTGPDSATTNAPSSATSTQSSMQFPATPSDGAHATTSYKEESLLRKDHFELGQPESRRRGTVPSGNQSEPASIGRSFMPERQARRNLSVMHLNKIKHDIAAASGSGSGSASQPAPGAPVAGTRGMRRSGAHSDSGQSGTDSSAASSSQSQSTISPVSRSKAPVSPTGRSAKKTPPPLLRTWHTPPSTGPPMEPLPSPPGSASLQPLILAGSARPAGSLPAPSPPPSPRKALPPLPPKDEARRVHGVPSSDSLREALASPPRSEPSSPASATVASAARGAPASVGRAGTGAGTGVREDAVKRVLADANASAAELRAALEAQSAKYARLMSYLLSLTERHGMEKHEFVRRIEALEADARRRERELKGLRWLVANQSQSQGGGGVGVGAKRREGGPARADSAVLPRSEARNRQRSASESVVSPSNSSAKSPAADSLARLSIDSPAGSTEEGLFETQTSIAEFIAPFVSPPVSDGPLQGESAVIVQRPTLSLSPLASGATTRLKRSNTLPDALGAPPPLVLAKQRQAKQARRTSSPILSLSSTPSPASGSSPLSSPPSRKVATVGRSSGSARTGLGIGILDLSSSLSGSSEPGSPSSDGGRGSERDPHARSDSSTLVSLPSLSTLHTSSSGLSSIPETPRTPSAFPHPVGGGGAPRWRKKAESDPEGEGEDRGAGRSRVAVARPLRRLSTSSLASSSSSANTSSAAGSRASASPSIGQVLERARQPEMDAILRKLRAFGGHHLHHHQHQHGSPGHRERGSP